MLEHFLCAADLKHATRVFEKLKRHDLSNFALTGGFATEMYCLQHERQPLRRPLNDIDFIVDSFDRIPESLADEFLFRHVHPWDPPGKTLLQLVDPDHALRIDIFRADGNTMLRTRTIYYMDQAIRLISLEDLTARAARLTLDMGGNVQTPFKYARDFLRLVELIDPEDVEAAWRDQRKPGHPATFREANTLLQSLIPARPHLLITPEYSKDPEEICPRCASTSAFPLTDPRVMLSLLGYC
jgi:hypothetical protein